MSEAGYTVRFDLDPRDFFEQTKVLYEKNETRHNLMLGLATRLASSPSSREAPWFAIVYKNHSDIAVTALWTPPFPILVQSDPLDEPAIENLVLELMRRDIYPSGVNGVAETSDAFARLWFTHVGVKAHLALVLGAYELFEVRMPDPMPEGCYRKALLSEAPKVLEMLFLMQAETGATTGVRKTLQEMEGQISRGEIYVWEQNQEITSIAFKTRPTQMARSISAVYTYPDLRSQGYASGLVASLAQEILDEGKQMVNLFTDRNNRTSNAIYQRIGFQHVCDYHQFTFLEAQ
ncbi:MAG: GNAT family N-acetyltransferase [Anaerolineaceae bacterium]|jgi:GNAT superfamily N-acetyltransferase